MGTHITPVRRAKKAGSASDPLWYKDAIIYELHVRAFADSNSDGIGDFPGLMQKLDYLQDLGVTCLWLLPFFPSPLRDDGYDIADYLTVHPSYGTLDDFKAFLDAAHQRGLQVMIELVINHSSDQHPWFQRARHAPSGSPERDFYVWSDTDQKYKDARIIFTDTEKSNWTWDPVAQAYFWHRFFSHQPDLNYDNPLVMEEVLKILRYWLDMGVDALRLDAIPYIVERDGTNCENLPETHATIKKIRAAMDEGYSNRVILAEANQWPTDVRPYFGDGDECHMAFHFPLMPRIYMALRQEDRLPITEIMAQTPEIPESCQWGLFLRNHDELTLEMVTDDERDYMYLAYSADPRMRINIGIRRRLAALVDNNRRRIELLNSILFSFPGTPILYYGDEIGMGDNIYLGDRNGVRTPMQWTADRNAGFSRANPAQLYSPVIMDPVWGYQAINVEAQQSDASSLLNWMRNMIALRKLFQVFGRGTLKFLPSANRKVLAYVRQYGNEQVLCLANLSRFAQPVQLDLAEFEGMTPIEMLGYVEFPTITKQAYPLTIGPYGFLWLEIQPASANWGEPAVNESPKVAIETAREADWEAIFTGPNGDQLKATVLPEFLQRQRWFGSKSKQIMSATVTDWCPFDDGRSALVMVNVEFVEGGMESYFVPLSVLYGEAAQVVRDTNSNAIVANVRTSDSEGLLCDAPVRESACRKLLSVISQDETIQSRYGTIRGSSSRVLAELMRGVDDDVSVRRSSAEQSNTSILFGDQLIMKCFRKQEFGPNPDTEIARFFTERTNFTQIAPFGGSIEYSRDGQSPATLVMLQGLVANQGDGWQWTLEELERYFESCASASLPLDSHAATEIESVRSHAGFYLEAASMLGRRTAEMHLALASSDEIEEFRPEIVSAKEIEQISAELANHAAQMMELLKANLSHLADDSVEMGALVLSKRRDTIAGLRQLAKVKENLVRTRIHGDYHLGQVLRAKADFVILDFEGEPARTLVERRRKQVPLKDVAGMLRSFHYAAFSAMAKHTTRRPEDPHQMEPWARLWVSAVAEEFLRAYRQTAAESTIVPRNDEAFQLVLNAYVLDKALYELGYELNNRPDWVRIPLVGILSLLS
ncbi:maltose alpha-D-glucosyltransferase [Alloacidobacterium dinghuense]|uniref:Maltokinase n=1 Tax=Alloacidobacterium dinghuense TaxID=2763107 RepID=A0A7G8BP42_9BACT|nr:maltose alpha-D-glucosyltransferase [Alloacidobacterium dinghuense]QNI34312.1 maltose alpha-D-glucosyltransferase [Alloacidobacterium dinghuense]